MPGVRESRKRSQIESDGEWCAKTIVQNYKNFKVLTKRLQEENEYIIIKTAYRFGKVRDNMDLQQQVGQPLTNITDSPCEMANS